MPLERIINLNDSSQLLVWKITETFDDLFQSVRLKDSSLSRVENMKADGHRRGFLSVRRLLMEAGYTDFDLFYDQYGKPHLEDGKHISISHSHDFSVIIISNKTIGVDLEILKDKTLKIAPRFMNVSHLEHLSEKDQLLKATVIWGIKEAVFKIKNEVGISFKDHIFENDFNLRDKKCSVELRFNNSIEHFDVIFEWIENYVLVCAYTATV
jgi:phosphopantetheinyl transferase